MSDARNYGLQHAQGDYVIFVDSDDFWVGNDSLAKLMKIELKFEYITTSILYMVKNENKKLIGGGKSNPLIAGFDLLKLLMALIVMNGHAGWNGYFNSALISDIQGVIYPLTVPVFFVISSLLFFKKIRKNESNNLRTLFNFEKRVNLLYLFWIIVLLPFVFLVFHPEYLKLTFSSAVCSILKDYFFGSIFNAAWYLGAMIVGVPLVFLLTKVLSARFCWIPALFVYLYLYNADNDSFLYHWYVSNVHNPMLSFPHSLCWLTIGYYLSNERILHKLSKNKWIYWLLLVVYVINGFCFPEYNYLLLLLAVPSIVLLAYFSDLNISNYVSRRMRIYSTHFYCIHTSIIVILGVLNKGCRVGNYFLCICICLLISEILIFLLRYKRFEWLKYSY